MLLNNNLDSSDENKLKLNDAKKISYSTSSDLTLKRKRLVRQEAVTVLEDKDPPPPPPQPQPQLPSTLEEEKPSIFSVQSESTGKDSIGILGNSN